MRYLFILLLSIFTMTSCADADGDATPSSTSSEGFEDVVEQDAIDCVLGEESCDCAENSTCLEGEGVCVEGVCVKEDCFEGILGCPCYKNGSCENDSEGNQVSCIDGVCSASEGSEEGAEGEQETDSCVLGSCSDGEVCLDEVCVPCEPGSPECSCGEDGGCELDFRCFNDVCVDPEFPGLPQGDPICYTPCEKGFVDSDTGEFRKCVLGLMEGCIQGADCKMGTCHVPGGGDEQGQCKKDLECPTQFQKCVVGTCTANCSVDAECPDKSGCDSKVCRVSCTGSGEECLEDEFCALDDGSKGFCRARPDVSEGILPAPDLEPFAVSPDAISLSNVFPRGTVRVSNQGKETVTVIVRRLSHEVPKGGAGVDRVTNRLEGPPSSECGDGLCDPDSEGCSTCADDCDICPLSWLGIGAVDKATADGDYEVAIEPGDEAKIELNLAGDSPGAAWGGAVEIIHPTSGSKTIQVSFQTSPQGQWTGKMYRFGEFATKNLDTWKSNPSLDLVTGSLNNALLQKWASFRYDGEMKWNEFQAILTATHNEEWVSAAEEPLCYGGLCYPYDSASNPAGPQLVFRTYTESQETAEIPSGVIEVPFSMNIMQDPADLTNFVGRINSATSLQYAANPQVQLAFEADPTGSDSGCGSGGGYENTGQDCVAPLVSFDSVIPLGGRFTPLGGDGICEDGWPEGSGELKAVPWLIPGFRGSTQQDENGVRSLVECRDKTVPFDDEAQSASLSGANPIPDGAARVRTISLLDGALINQSVLYVLYEERFETLASGGGDGFVSYGYIRLEKGVNFNEVDFNSDKTYEGTTADLSEIEPVAEDVLALGCTPDVLEMALGDSFATLDSSNASTVMSRLLSGEADGDVNNFIKGSEEVHYYCQSTGNFDQGPNGDLPCPADGKLVTYFTVNDDVLSFEDIENNACQSENPFQELGVDATVEGTVVDPEKRGECLNVLNTWAANPSSGLMQLNPVWKCKDSQRVLCDDNRYFLTQEKEFYEEPQGNEPAPLLPIQAEISQAFRYKTQFVSRSGANVGFAPEICIPNSNAKPYCYDPVNIERISERTACLVHIWDQHRPDLSVGNRAALIDYLTHAFSYQEVDHWLCETNKSPCPLEERIDLPKTTEDGFEHNWAELLVMMGDEASTQAGSSRFDLSDSKSAVFEGSLFEPGGINLSSTAGFEMFSLYQAAQYYEMVLNRFYAMSPVFKKSVEADALNGQGFVSPATVTWYIKKVVRASTSLSDTWSQIAERYGALNEPELARRVVERAYTHTYLSAVVMSRMMQGVLEVTLPDDRAQVRAAVLESQRRYSRALRLMGETYEALNAERAFFGISEDLVPIPQAQGFADSPFEVMFNRLESQMSLAKLREDTAINSSREYEVDEAAFGSELANIRNTYENQLVDLCGSMEGDTDGLIYPATQKYSHLNAAARLYGDPCGKMGGGEIHEAKLSLEIAGTELARENQAAQGVIDRMTNERNRISALCDTVYSFAQYSYEKAGERYAIEEDINEARATIQHLDRITGILAVTSSLGVCSAGPAGTDCPQSGAALGVYLAGSVIAEFAIIGIDAGIASDEADLAELEKDLAKWDTEGECDMAEIESDARMADLLVELKIQRIEMLRAAKGVALKASTVDQLINKSKRILTQQLEAEELSVNVAAAKTDPNVRILKNDAVTNAEISFKKAMQAAYRLTLVYEYYTSTSYAKAEDLYLIRMISHGQPNLENYALEIQNAFFEFEQTYGISEQRLLVVSLMNDVIGVPRLDAGGAPLSTDERLALYRSELTGLENRNENGWLVFGFDTNFASTSPVSRVHKIDYIEANVEYAEGDLMSVLYLRQKGKSSIFGLNNEKTLYDIPERTAVIHAKQYGATLAFAGPELYKSKHLADRPLVNNGWELMVNDQDEPWNIDDRVEEWGDVKLYIHYKDFTSFQ